MSASRKPFHCLDCDVDTGKINEYYMVDYDLWESAGMSPVGMLCIGCLEKRIGRELNSSDFLPVYVNGFRFAPKSARLTSRLLSFITEKEKENA